MSPIGKPCRLCVYYRRRKPSDEHRPRTYGWCALQNVATHANQTCCKEWREGETDYVTPAELARPDRGGETMSDLRPRDYEEACEWTIEMRAQIAALEDVVAVLSNAPVSFDQLTKRMLEEANGRAARWEAKAAARKVRLDEAMELLGITDWLNIPRRIAELKLEHAKATIAATGHQLRRDAESAEPDSLNPQLLKDAEKAKPWPNNEWAKQCPLVSGGIFVIKGDWHG